MSDSRNVTIIGCASLLFIILASLSTVHSQSECMIPDVERVDGYFTKFEGLGISTASDKVIDSQRYTNKVLVKFSQRTYETENFKVDVGISFYDVPWISVEDAMTFPTLATGKDWQGSAYGNHLRFQKSLKVSSSENVEYTTDIRVTDDCYVVRGFWHDIRRKSYDLGPDLEEGEKIVGDLVDSIVKGIDEDYYRAVEPVQEDIQLLTPLPTQPLNYEASEEEEGLIEPEKKPEVNQKTYYRSTTPEPVSEEPPIEEPRGSQRSFSYSVNELLDFVDSLDLTVKLLLLVVFVWGILLILIGN